MAATRYIYTCCLYVFALVASLSSVQGQEAFLQEQPVSPVYLSLQVENDAFSLSGDRLYTHGVEFSYLPLNQTPPDWLFQLSAWTPHFHQSPEVGYFYQFGQKLFTPEATWSHNLEPEQQPYAGWLYSSATLFRPNPIDEILSELDSITYTLGVVGPLAMGDQTQNAFHGFVGDGRAEGWGNQLKNEVGFIFDYLHKWRIKQKTDLLQYDISPHISMALGNVYTYLGGGMMLRLGRSLPSDFGPPSIRPGFPGIGYFEPNNGLNAYFYLGYESRYMNRNIFLDGNTFTTSHRVHREPIVGDFQIGWVFSWPQFRLSISRMDRSKEYDGQSTETSYGAINFSWLQ